MSIIESRDRKKIIVDNTFAHAVALDIAIDNED